MWEVPETDHLTERPRGMERPLHTMNRTDVPNKAARGTRSPVDAFRGGFYDSSLRC